MNITKIIINSHGLFHRWNAEKLHRSSVTVCKRTVTGQWSLLPGLKSDFSPFQNCSKNPSNFQGSTHRATQPGCGGSSGAPEDLPSSSAPQAAERELSQVEDAVTGQYQEGREVMMPIHILFAPSVRDVDTDTAGASAEWFHYFQGYSQAFQIWRTKPLRDWQVNPFDFLVPYCKLT